jgi:uncharacterized protein (DUF1684 family)
MKMRRNDRGYNWTPPWILSTVLIASVAAAALGQGSYESSISTWRQKHEAGLKADDGWLTVSGLFWLKDGDNSFGSDPDNDVVLPGNKGPARAGKFILKHGEIKVRANADAGVYEGEKSIRDLVLKTDSDKSPDVLRIGDLSLIAIKRGERYGIRIKDTNSRPRREFTGLHWFPVQESYRVTAKFVPGAEGREIAITNVLGDVQNMKSPGTLIFNLNGHPYSLDPVAEDDGKLFIIFRDSTGGRSTYAAGRFLYADAPKDGVVTLDFNKAENPPCAFTAYATCPLPPRQNILDGSIEAGEKRYDGPGSQHASHETARP